MKTFLNVLYRRILYKIPLKLLLVLIAIFGVLFACFSSAETIPGDNFSYYSNENGYYLYYSYSVDVSSYTANRPKQVDISNDFDFVCVRHNPNSLVYFSLTNSPYNWLGVGVNVYENCFDGGTTLYLYGDTTAYFYFFNVGEGVVPISSSLQCQTEYNLIPISSVDQNYCTTNNLCPSCPVCPVGTGGYSQLYINNILHLGAPNIIMNIPDEIDWDYAYTQGGQNMNIDVVGYNVDYEKIDSIVQFQNYKPSSEDFQKIIGLLAPYTKIIVFFVFLFIVWAWIKKPFKSKKL